MQKKLITLAIAGALAIPGAAMADVGAASGSDITIYGKFHASWDYVDNGATVAGNDDSDDNSAVFRNSRLGFKGAEDVGSGIKAIWQVETDLKTGNSNDAAGNMELRNTFVGLQGDNWGTIFMGKHDTPYKTATAKLDIFSDTIADYNNIIGSHMNALNAFGSAVYAAGSAGARQQTFNARPNQVVAYETPNFNGFKGQLARASIQSPDVLTEETEAWSAMGMYDQGPFFASLAYEVYSGAAGTTGAAGNPAGGGNVTSPNKEKIDAWKVGLGYTFGNSSLGFVYEDIGHDDDAAGAAPLRASRDAFWLGASHKFGANVVKLAYGKADDSDANNNDGADNWSIGVDHNFSKRTKVYAIYTDMDNDTNANYALNSEDGASAYAPGQTATGNTGGDVSAFSVGIIHSF
uniref:Outer membrane protein (Porin) n=1 Tax=Candidatus Kentrum sp. DK TaxID=2126562 RepID=A0A450SAA9_9GAMM|nr:MAG: Outer membrane protein (porin) [Candidatus Kentron sp. DK]